MGIIVNGSSVTDQSSGPYAPEYIPQAAGQVSSNVTQATQGAASAQQNLQQYIQHLYALQQVAKNAAKSATARGANSQQNPLAVFRSVQDAAAQAGIPMDAQISQTLQQSNNIQNTLNNLLTNAASQYAQLGSIQKSQSHSETTTAGSGEGKGGGGSGGDGSGSGRGRGGSGGGAGDGGGYTDIRGNVSARRGGPVVSPNNDWVPGAPGSPASQDFLNRLNGGTGVVDPSLQAEQDRLMNLIGPKTSPNDPTNITVPGMTYGSTNGPGMQFTPTPLDGSLPSGGVGGGTGSTIGNIHNFNMQNYGGSDIHSDVNPPFDPGMLQVGNEDQWGVPNLSGNNSPAFQGPYQSGSVPNVGGQPNAPVNFSDNGVVNAGANFFDPWVNQGSGTGQFPAPSDPWSNNALVDYGANLFQGFGFN